MNFNKFFSGTFICGLLILTIATGGCTSSGSPASGPETGSNVGTDTGGYAGVYKNTDDAAVAFTLNADGKFQHSNGVSHYSGTWSYVDGQFKFCTVENDGTSCFYAPIAADGSFTYGYNTFRK
jgi:hypothetical protein